MTEQEKAFVEAYEKLCREHQMRVTTSKDAPYYEGNSRVLTYSDPRLFDVAMERVSKQIRDQKE